MVTEGKFLLGCCDIYLRVSEAKVFMPQKNGGFWGTVGCGGVG